jgi:hypothetical protein
MKKVDLENRSQLNRREFLQKSAIVGAATSAAALFPAIGCRVEPAKGSAGTLSSNIRSLTPKMLLNETASFSKPLLASSQLGFRLGLARTRMSSYPLDSLDFVMMDLERPDNRSRHAHWCTGDLTGRLLEFLSYAEGVDGKNDPRLDVLFERILKQRRPSGFMGRHSTANDSTLPEDDPLHGGAATGRLFHGLIQYYDLTADTRALKAAEDMAGQLWSVRDEWSKRLKAGTLPNTHAWVTEPFARLYGISKDERWLEFCGMIRENCPMSGHNPFMSVLRGLQTMAFVTGDLSWNEKPEQARQWIIREKIEMPDGCTPEGFPNSSRNEGCSIADWLMLNLNEGLILGDDSAYDKAERIFWNALSFNQLVTGGFGCRRLTPNGYGLDQLEESWWCCTQSAGQAMAMYAQHTVTFRDGTIHVNFLTPGRFLVRLPGDKWANVKIATTYPSRAEATIEADNVPSEMMVKLRVPSCVRKPEVKEARTGNKVQISFHGELGHRIEQCHPGVILTYGPLVLAPCAWVNTALQAKGDNTVPPGYIPKAVPAGIPVIKTLKKADADGFVQLPLCPPERPLPDWTYFEEGPGAPTWVEGASVEVQLKFPAGNEVPVRFIPMCYTTSNLSLFETPFIFRNVE